MKRSVNPLWTGLALGGRTPLAVSRPDDPSEREADRIADRITAQPEARVQRSCAACAGGTAPCPKCEGEQPIQRQTADGAAGVRPGGVGGVETLGSGHALDAQTRQWFEPRLGAELGGVRIHTDASAGEAAAGLGARAFAVGDHIAFAPGEFVPGSQQGRRLLAHELVHVLQTDQTKVHRSVVSGGESEAPAYGEGRAPGGSHSPPPSPPPRAAAIPRPETCPPPEDMSCPPAMTSPGAVTNTLIFPVNSATLDGLQQAEIDAAAASWHAAGGAVLVRIDGYASAEGACEYNWDLSCRRAQAVAAELETPSDGSPGVRVGDVELFAHGESDEAGRALAPNRKATISIPVAPPSPPPVSPPPCPLPVLLGTGRSGCGAGTDFTHFDFPGISLRSEAILGAWAAARNSSHLPFRSMVSDVDCMTEMASVLGGTAGAEGLAAFAHFVGGSGTTVTHGASSTLGSMALAAGSFATTVATVKTDIETQLAAQASSGALDPCALSVTPPGTSFRTSGALTLNAVIGGTQGEKLLATGFTGSIPMRSYSIDLQFNICDDFGVDEADLYFFGLIPFWILQHERSASLYAPFINELQLPVTVSGTF